MQSQIGYDILSVGSNLNTELKNKMMKSFIWSFVAVIPSILIGIFLKESPMSIEYGYFVSCTILLLAVFNFATVVFIDQYRNIIGRVTIPALIGSEVVIFMFVIAESFNRFVPHIDYNYITPFALIAVILIYISIFNEKQLALKAYLSLNTIALLLLWSMGVTDKVIMPF